jgi:hypothetical protein
MINIFKFLQFHNVQNDSEDKANGLRDQNCPNIDGQRMNEMGFIRRESFQRHVQVIFKQLRI